MANLSNDKREKCQLLEKNVFFYVFLVLGGHLEIFLNAIRYKSYCVSHDKSFDALRCQIGPAVSEIWILRVKCYFHAVRTHGQWCDHQLLYVHCIFSGDILW